jgi:Putative DNA-binding domain
MAHPKFIDTSFINALVSASTPEGQEIEYKRALPPRDANKADKDAYVKLAHGVSALANADGGLFIYGIHETGDERIPKLNPITTEESFDDIERRLRQVIEDRIEPHIVGLTFHKVDVEGGYVLVIRVPPNLGGPYWWYEVDDKRKFSIRRGNHNVDMSYMELRAAFDRSASATVSANDWIERRVARFPLGDYWPPLPRGPLLVFHAVPLLAFQQASTSIDLKFAQQKHRAFPIPWYPRGGTTALNFDGFQILAPRLNQTTDDARRSGYVQLFRNGSFESVGVLIGGDSDATNFSPVLAANMLHEAIMQTPTALESLGVDGPLIIGAAMLRTKGYTMIHVPELGAGESDRSDLIMPGLILDDPSSLVERQHIAGLALDMFWQGFGYTSCPYINDDGSWGAN